MNFYEFEANSLAGDLVKMDQFTGKTVLVVNTASKCGLTPQYKGLEELYERYRDNGFVILGFPCNQFANQEPGDENSISEVCLLNYGVTFPMFAKVDVNGENAHPIFKFLKNELHGKVNNEIKWNFTKFLIDAQGKPVKRFSPLETPEIVGEFVSRLLN
jgi:glutathione peroxidase